MTKITKEQAVSAVQRATTQETIEAILISCKRVVMREVFESITHELTDMNEISDETMKAKNLLAHFYAEKIMRFKG